MNFLDTLNRYYEEGWLIKQTHPELPLTIWNYSQTTQFERHWDEITLQCRGLVTDDETGEVVARPFEKFFNIEEDEHTPTKNFSIYEKMDGSLGISFNYKGDWIFASRGSFTSEQCLKGIDILNASVNERAAQPLNPEFTYMFEIIYPENRIVVNYGKDEKVVMLGAINTKTGEEMSYCMMRYLHDYGWDIVKKYDNIADYSTLKSIITDNQEGFVKHFENGDRCKVKGDEYIRLHRIMTNASTKSVWEILRNGDSMEEFLKEVPDEFYEKIRDCKNELEAEYWELAGKVKSIFKSIYRDDMGAREFSNEIKYLDRVYQGLLWSQFNIKMNGYSDAIWYSIQPKFKKL